MTLQEIQYKAQAIVQKWRDEDSAPYVEFVEELALMDVPELPEGLEEEIDKYFRLWRQGASDEGCVNAGSQFVSIYDCHRIARHFAEWQYQKDRGEFAKLKPKEWSDGYNEGIVRGKEQAEQDLGWHSVEESLPEMDEDVIVLTDELGTAPIYKISFGHIVDVERCIDYNGWNCPGVKYWMPCPKILNND